MATVTVTSVDVLKEWLRLSAEVLSIGPGSTERPACCALARDAATDSGTNDAWIRQAPGIGRSTRPPEATR
jgi:hypothetical protein